MLVSVSILSCYDNLIDSVKKVNKSNADYLHIDVMDGKFVDNEKFSIDITYDVIESSEKKIDLHLMVDSIDTVKKYALLKPDYLTFHVEIIKDDSIIKYLKSLGIKVGLAINPETSIDKLMPYINDIDLVLFMSVNPGYGGQAFKEEVLDKIIKLKECINDNIIISIDGGINSETIDKCKCVGCNMVVAGSFITNNDNYDISIDKLK